MKVLGVLAATTGLIVTLAIGTRSDPDAVPTADEVAGRTMSPFCEGLTLNECPHSKSAALRAEIDSMVRAGATNRQIDEWMERNYGIVSQGRPRSGPAWLAPLAAVVLGVAAVLLLLRRPQSPRPANDSPPAKLSEDEEARFAEDFGSFVKGTE